MSASESGILKKLSTDDIGKELDGVIVTAVKSVFDRNGFVIFACKGGFTVKGNCPEGLIEGMNYKVSGKVTSYNGKPQITAGSIELIETDENDEVLIAGFLKDNFDSVGEKLAQRLAAAYGNEVLQALLNDPEAASSAITGLSVELAADIARKYEEDTVFFETVLELRKLGLSNKKAVKVYDQYGSTCIDVIKDNPYILMRISGIGFETCEAIAKRLNAEPVSISRFEGAIVSAVNDLHEQTKDTWFDPDTVRKHATSLIMRKSEVTIPQDVFDGLYHDAVVRAKEDKFIVVYRFTGGKCAGCEETDEGARVSSMSVFGTEHAIKKQIEEFLKAKTHMPDKDKTVTKIISMGKQRDLELEQNQIEAIFMCMYSPISIITGGPGTGKTTITSILAQHFRDAGIECEFCAPTGRAAKRLSEATGEKACTIHRLLEMSAPSDEEDDRSDLFFGRNKKNPLECRVVVADEASMIDIFLFKALLDALRPGASLILVGDPEQLPSVSEGNVLEDLLSCASIPRVKLQYVFRQGVDSSIAANAARILKGEYPVGGDDFEIIKTASDEEAVPFITRLSADNRECDHAILCPTRQKILGTENLNVILQESNNEGEEEPAVIRPTLKLYHGDNVMQVKNNYSIEYYDPASCEVQRGIYNGEMGRFQGFDVLTGKYDILFDGDRKIGFDKKNMSDIELSYAITVHKAQGCEFDRVTIVLGFMNSQLSSRKLLYTAVTRGKNKVTIIDSGERLSKMLKSDVKASRNTSLKDFLAIVQSRHKDGDS